jgi:SAM-dependent methyltransferase
MRDSTERFSDRVADYARYRPDYPPAVLAVLVAEAGLTADWVVADVGAGTGLSTRLFLGNGNRVVAVEPNAEMRAAVEWLLGGVPGFRSVAGTAEATGLRESSVDLVVCAQAFHWFDPARTRAEFLRILKPGGWVALIWNTRRTAAAPFMGEYEALLERYGTDYGRVRHDRLPSDLLERFFGGPFRRLVVPHAQNLDRDGLRGRLLSSSYTPAEGDPARDALLRAADEMFARHARNGRVRLEYDTEIHLGRLAPGPSEEGDGV